MKRGIILYDIGQAKSGIGNSEQPALGPIILGNNFVAANFWEESETQDLSGKLSKKNSGIIAKNRVNGVCLELTELRVLAKVDKK